jgi:hypothetical protein
MSPHTVPALASSPTTTGRQHGRRMIIVLTVMNRYRDVVDGDDRRETPSASSATR